MYASERASRLKPRCALRVGVVGNRRFADESDDKPLTRNAAAARIAVAAALRELWQMLAKAMTTALDKDNDAGTARVRMRQLFSDESRGSPC